jgi:parvulin-like peptidyl-prolyl isomerase
MRGRLFPALAASVGALLGLAFAWLLHGQEIIDRIAARVENDVILMSDLRELSRYQQLVDGKTEPDEQLLDRLIDQWIVRSEAEASRFPQPSDADINRGTERLQKSFASPEEYESRKKQSGLSDAGVRRMVASQLYLSNYLDSRFRPSVQIDAKAIEDFYQSGVIPRAQARGQTPPTLEDARDFIQEALVQRGINEQADRWLKESRARLHVDKLPREATK